MDLIDREKEPKLTEKEWGRLKTCEGPCSKEEWGLMTSNAKWQTMGNLGLSKREEKGAEAAPSEKGKPSSVEQNAPPPTPQSAKPPPPMPPSLEGESRRDFTL